MNWQEQCLDEARAIADRLMEQAVVHRGRANWITRRVPYPGDKGAVDALPRLMNLNPSVYSGTAGMGILYARLHKATGARAYADLARAAMEHATKNAVFVNDSSLGMIGGHYRNGFYLGVAGIAWAAHETGRLLESAHLHNEAGRLVRWLRDHRDEPSEVDLINGYAGGVTAMVDMAEDVPGARALAEELGQDMLRSAVPGEEGSLSWGNRHLGGGRNLTGFSHGTAGAAYALARLHGLTGDDRYREAMEGALLYEEQGFYEDLDNWANYQGRPGADGRYAVGRAWCHGAPGIGIGRAATQPHVEAGRFRRDLEAAVRTTSEALRQNLAAPGTDYMLCHGVGGLVECLWAQKDALEPGSGHDAASRAVRVGLRQHGRAAIEQWGTAVEWPTPVANGLYPPLVTGIGGIAHLLLRLARPREVPSVLVPALPSTFN